MSRWSLRLWLLRWTVRRWAWILLRFAERLGLLSPRPGAEPQRNSAEQALRHG